MYYFLKDVLNVSDDTAHNDSCLVEHLLSSETREKLFTFMKEVAQTDACLNLETELELNKYNSHEEFTHAQKGDKYLE